MTYVARIHRHGPPSDESWKVHELRDDGQLGPAMVCSGVRFDVPSRSFFWKESGSWFVAGDGVLEREGTGYVVKPGA